MATVTVPLSAIRARGKGGRLGKSFLHTPRLDFSIGFAYKGKSCAITLLGMEEDPLPRVQQFSILATEKKSFGKFRKNCIFQKEVSPPWSWKLGQPSGK
jgi:hypothetical protein